MTERSKRFIVKEKRPESERERGSCRKKKNQERESTTLRGKIYQVLNLTGTKSSRGTGLKKTNTSK